MCVYCKMDQMRVLHLSPHQKIRCNTMQHTATCCNTGYLLYRCACTVECYRCAYFTCHRTRRFLLHCVALCCSVWQRVAVCCSVLQCVAACRIVPLSPPQKIPGSGFLTPYTFSRLICTTKSKLSVVLEKHNNTLQHTATYCNTFHHTTPHGELSVVLDLRTMTTPE